MTRPPRRGTAGFTLLELLIALAIVGALVAVAFGGLRVGLAAWTQGEERAEAHQHVRGVALTVVRALRGTYPYRASRGTAPEPVVLFDGAERRVELVTDVAPFPGPTPVAFTAVSIALEEGERRGLVIRQRPLPNREPFGEDAVVAFHDPTVTRLALSYMDRAGVWGDTWDGAKAEATPRAIRVTIGMARPGRADTTLTLTVPLPVGTTL
jgi:prepilin-type N-terminal cleavage/methylation domain-containing protein